jgi:crossover junction endodeoxyribonuclease RuvC
MAGILGIDPGISGACALFNPSVSAASGLRWVVWDMPVAGDPAELDAKTLRDLIQKYSPSEAVLERVNAMPVIGNRATGQRRGMGATSAFRFGGMFYSLKAVLACCDIPFSLIGPSKWKAHHGLAGPDKENSRQLALAKFPDMKAALARKMDENRAEAMLIAAYKADFR